MIRERTQKTILSTYLRFSPHYYIISTFQSCLLFPVSSWWLNAPSGRVLVFWLFSEEPDSTRRTSSCEQIHKVKLLLLISPFCLILIWKHEAGGDDEHDETDIKDFSSLLFNTGGKNMSSFISESVANTRTSLSCWIHLRGFLHHHWQVFTLLCLVNNQDSPLSLNAAWAPSLGASVS